jgi:hypothetical protein
MSTRRTRDDLAAEIEALYAELEDINGRISDVLDDGDPDDVATEPEDDGDD